MFLRQRRQHGSHQPRRPGGGGDHHRAADRVAFVRHGRGTALARRGGFEDLADVGLHQQGQVAAELAQAAGDQAKQAGELHQAIALGMPGLVGQVEPEFTGQCLGNRPGLLAERSQRAGGTTELEAQEPRSEFGEPLAMTGHGAEPAGDLHAEGYRGGML